MGESVEHYVVDVMSGRRRGLGAGALRLVLSAAEPFYSGAMRLRNFLYDRGIKSTHALPRPAISVGNITAGGTGKTPMVQWLAGKLRAGGIHPCILLRGYKSTSTGQSDELAMLDAHLNANRADRIQLRANPDRVAAAREMVEKQPEIDVFILDDGFQHRRAGRGFDLVLISATNPFGYGHVHPRGLLREPLAGLRRAGAIVITRANEVDSSVLKEIESQIRRYSSAPIYHADYVLASSITSEGQQPLEHLTRRRFAAFCGIGDPDTFEKQLRSLSGELVAMRRFSDHHDYTRADIESVQATARDQGAELILTTEKDWVKVQSVVAPGLPIWRLDLAIQFRQGEDALLRDIRGAISRARGG